MTWPLGSLSRTRRRGSKVCEKSPVTKLLPLPVGSNRRRRRAHLRMVNGVKAPVKMREGMYELASGMKVPAIVFETSTSSTMALASTSILAAKDVPGFQWVKEHSLWCQHKTHASVCLKEILQTGVLCVKGNAVINGVGKTWDFIPLLRANGFVWNKIKRQWESKQVHSAHIMWSKHGETLFGLANALKKRIANEESEAIADDIIARVERNIDALRRHMELNGVLFSGASRHVLAPTPAPGRCAVPESWHKQQHCGVYNGWDSSAAFRERLPECSVACATTQGLDRSDFEDEEAFEEAKRQRRL